MSIDIAKLRKLTAGGGWRGPFEETMAKAISELLDTLEARDEALQAALADGAELAEELRAANDRAASLASWGDEQKRRADAAVRLMTNPSRPADYAVALDELIDGPEKP